MPAHADSTDGETRLAAAEPGQRPPTALRFPFGLLVCYLLGQLLLLAGCVLPGVTGRSVLAGWECWAFLAGGQTLFVSWLWPLLRLGPGRAGWRSQATLEAVLLGVASVPAAVMAGWWADVSAARLLAPGTYWLMWLLAGWLVAGAGARGGPLRVVYSVALTLANFGLLGLAYLGEDFLGRRLAEADRFSPMCQAARLAEAGWPPLAGILDRAALALPAVVAAVALLVLVLTRPAEPRA